MRDPRVPAGGASTIACLTIGAASLAALTSAGIAPPLAGALAAAGCAALFALFDAASPGTRRLAPARSSAASPRLPE